MEYPPQRQYFPPATPPQQNLTTRAAEAGKMGGVTPEIWDDILQQLQQLINENGSLRNTLEANNRQMQGIIEKKGRETSSAQKLYWDARISVLGFKAQIMKLTGERDQLFEKSREVDTTELEHELDQLKKEKISAEAVTRKFQDEMETLKRTLQQWKERENSLVQTMEREKEQMRDSYEQQIAAFQKTPPVPRPRVNVPNSEIADLKRENDDLKRENAGLKRDQSELREQVDHHSVEITELRRKNTHRSENTEGQLLALQRELEKLRVSENELRDKLRQARRTEDELNNELIDKNKQIENLKLRSPQTEPQTMDFGAGGGSGGSARLRKLLNEEAGKSKRLAEQISLKNDEVAKLTKQYEINLLQVQDQLDHVGQQLQEKENELQLSQTTIQIYAERIQPQQDQWIIDKNEVTLTRQILGKGAYGHVEVGVFRGLRVAVKSLHHLIISHYNLALFSREMDIASRVRHPNLVQFIGATRVGNPLIVTELMSTSLYKELQTKKLTQPQIVSIGQDVALGLNYLHLWQPNPIIHRDVSSPNVLLEPSANGGYKAKVADYGTANLQQQARTDMPGNPAYAAPESRYPDDHSPSMDVYSYCVLLMEINLCCSPEMTVKGRAKQALSLSWPAMKALVQNGLNDNHKARPTMGQILQTLKGLL